MNSPMLIILDPMSKEQLTADDFSEFVINMRQSIGLSRREFAKVMGVNRGTVVFWERGNIIPHDFEAILRTMRIVVKLRIRNRRISA